MSGREYGHPAVWLAPAVLLVLAVFPLPYGYYTLLRICICGASAYLAFQAWERESSVGLWVVVFAVLAVLYNPLVPVYLTKGIWAFINLGTAALLVAHLWWTRR